MANINNVFVQVTNKNTISKENPKSDFAPLLSPYNDKISPNLATMNKFRRLNVIKEDIPLPAIAVVGDTFSCKSCVIKSLVGISLPSSTRVPIIMRLESHLNSEPELLLEYNSFTKTTIRIMDESQISRAIEEATKEIPGSYSGHIYNRPLTLVVKKKGITDITIIDLPEIEKKSWTTNTSVDIAMEYVKPKENIILNVVCSNSITLSCESLNMSRRADKTGERTLIVVTHCDTSLDKLFEDYVRNNPSIQHNHIFVTNPIRSETFDEARIREATFFRTHPLLSRLNKSMVGISALAHKINQIQMMIILKGSSDTIKNLDDKLNASVPELNELSNNLMSIPHGIDDFIPMVGSLEKSLEKILMKGEFDEYPNDIEMHGNARLAEMLEQFSDELHASIKFPNHNFLVEEIGVLEETNGTRLPYFFPQSVFLRLLERKVINISKLLLDFANKVCGYLETVCVKVVVDRLGKTYPWFLSSMKKASHNVTKNMKDKFVERIGEMIEMEKITDYTCDPNYISCWNKLMGNPREEFLKAIHNENDGVTTTHVEGYGKMDVKHLLKVSEYTRNQAFDLKMRMTAYWSIVVKRMVDWTALQLQFLIRKSVRKELYMEIVNEVIVLDGGFEDFLDDETQIAHIKRGKLYTSIGLLRESKQVIREVMNVGNPHMID